MSFVVNWSFASTSGICIYWSLNSKCKNFFFERKQLKAKLEQYWKYLLICRLRYNLQTFVYFLCWFWRNICGMDLIMVNVLNRAEYYCTPLLTTKCIIWSDNICNEYIDASFLLKSLSVEFGMLIKHVPAYLV